MKVIAVMNGWIAAPHCWRRYLFCPVSVDRVPGRWTAVSLFGVVVFFANDQGQDRP